MVLNYKKSVIVVTGPTGIGKTGLSIDLAREFDCPIISADSRQIFKELKIGTAAPTNEELRKATHYLIGTHSIFDYYSAYKYEQEALALVDKLFEANDVVILTGGSMMYIDAFCNGIDELPTIDPELRDNLQEAFRKEGLENIRRQLKLLDPVFYNQLDLKNPKRIIHALEICLMTGRPYSALRTNTKKIRPFHIVKIGLDMDRSLLHQRINQRVDQMMQDGLENEARGLYAHRTLNSLNTVGYREFFDFFDNIINREKAIELVKRNSRRYARKQLSWFRRDEEITWFSPQNTEEVITFVQRKIKRTGAHN
ncbi:tRNA (adenosine(37)-N6)-dimethylallyltransferase MiaA [Marinilabilia sp.]|uniref:tRNA (adenosine(37)-N6)-dimethylallyltransferase MiaA n=1 Tax=Marinilabilia sp. TaxID=2021252 RepID=UPI0025B850FD|nr:tRNA (adenosine(37)-N6)-dimethylallyltransferase MiaA [Marinilabilia sp.]